MKRETGIEKIRARKARWDVIVIGGGATGLGIALDAASRNYSVLLLEQHDFAKGTSSRSTKLIHGGVRYLQQGNVALVLEALRERGILKKNAPHLVKDLSFVIPAYDWWDGPFYAIGLKLYDLMAGRLSMGSSLSLSKKETVEKIPTIEQKGLRGGVIYHDGQFDDARMAITLAMTADDYGAVVVNYMQVVNIIKESDIAVGVEVVDRERGERFSVFGKSIINATGVFADEVIKMDNSVARGEIIPSQGVHLVVDRDFLPGDYAFLIPQTSDGRILFAVPWHGKVLLGTTDTMVAEARLEPKALDEEVDFIISNAARYLAKKPSRMDVKSLFAGLRPLVSHGGNTKATREISRSHKVTVSDSGLISVVGGKWTTYRKMAEDAMRIAILVGDLEERECITQDLLLHGYMSTPDFSQPLHVYGNDLAQMSRLEEESPLITGWLSETLQIKKFQVIWAVREEMARTVEDVLARRTRALFLDAMESLRIAEETAKIMAHEMRKDESWIAGQVREFSELAHNYLL